MARLIPPFISDDTNRGEADIFRRLERDRGTEKWMVLHSLNLARHDFRVAGEVDFVVLIPGKGVLCLEVKGHSRISSRNGVWYFGDERKGDPRGPFKQVSEALHSLRNYIAKSSHDLRTVPFWSAVIFPFLDFRERSVEWHDWQVIDRSALSSLPLSTLLERVIDSGRFQLTQIRSAKWFRPEDKQPNEEQSERIVRLLRPSFEVFRPMASVIQQREIELTCIYGGAVPSS